MRFRVLMLGLAMSGSTLSCKSVKCGSSTQEKDGVCVPSEDDRTKKDDKRADVEAPPAKPPPKRLLTAADIAEMLKKAELATSCVEKKDPDIGGGHDQFFNCEKKDDDGKFKGMVLVRSYTSSEGVKANLEKNIQMNIDLGLELKVVPHLVASPERGYILDIFLNANGAARVEKMLWDNEHVR